MEYTHLPLGESSESISGSYTPEQEIRLDNGGREVLYITGLVDVDASCCGIAKYHYAVVPGYVIKWHSGKNDGGLPVTEVEPVKDKSAKESIEAIIKKNDNVLTVDFW